MYARSPGGEQETLLPPGDYRKKKWTFVCGRCMWRPGEIWEAAVVIRHTGRAGLSRSCANLYPAWEGAVSTTPYTIQ